MGENMKNTKLTPASQRLFEEQVAEVEFKLTVESGGEERVYRFALPADVISEDEVFRWVKQRYELANASYTPSDVIGVAHRLRRKRAERLGEPVQRRRGTPRGRGKSMESSMTAGPKLGQ